ncbi:MAG: hypothetical protein K0S41_4044 [Anaerocolumna sp.]|jgi:hypothetical protein|nr:hypothetical protein [Anaerocolumna sp.]
MNKNKLYIIIIALVILNLYTLAKIKYLENTVNNHYQQYINSQSMFNQNINNIYNNVDEKLKKQASILDSYNVTFGTFDSEKLMVPIEVSITPKEFSDGLEAFIAIGDEIIPLTRKNTNYTGTFKMNVFHDFNMKAILDYSGTKKTETIEEYFSLREKFLLGISGGFGGTSSYSSNTITFDGDINFDFNTVSDNAVTSITIIQELNGNIIKQETIDAAEIKHDHIVIKEKDRIMVSVKDKFLIYALITDKYGLTYRFNVETFQYLISNGTETQMENRVDLGLVSEIRDKNGNILYDFLKEEDKK